MLELDQKESQPAPTVQTLVHVGGRQVPPPIYEHRKVPLLAIVRIYPSISILLAPEN